MRFHAIILAALSTGALSASLSAKEPVNSHNQPNTKCEGKDKARHHGGYAYLKEGTCHPYSPPDGSYVHIDYFDHFGTAHSIDVFKDSACEDFVTNIAPAHSTLKKDRTTDCVFMGEGVQWGSVRMGDQYKGPGADRVEGGVV